MIVREPKNRAGASLLQRRQTAAIRGRSHSFKHLTSVLFLEDAVPFDEILDELRLVVVHLIREGRGEKLQSEEVWQVTSVIDAIGDVTQVSIRWWDPSTAECIDEVSSPPWKSAGVANAIPQNRS